MRQVDSDNIKWLGQVGTAEAEGTQRKEEKAEAIKMFWVSAPSQAPDMIRE